MRTVRTVLLAAACLAAGCSQGHLSKGFGMANREAFAMQQPPLPAPPAPTNQSLDTQEAEVVSTTYLKGLAGKAQRGTDPDPVLYVAPAQRQQPPQLPPSVPQN